MTKAEKNYNKIEAYVAKKGVSSYAAAKALGISSLGAYYAYKKKVEGASNGTWNVMDKAEEPVVIAYKAKQKAKQPETRIAVVFATASQLKEIFAQL